MRDDKSMIQLVMKIQNQLLEYLKDDLFGSRLPKEVFCTVLQIKDLFKFMHFQPISLW